MTINAVLQRDSRQRLLVEGARISLFLIILLVSLASDVFQPSFINWGMLAPFYALITLAMILHLGVVGWIEGIFRRPGVLFSTFVLDAILISGLIYYSGLNQSLFLFLHLINILVAGIVFRTEGALIVALLTSLFFTGAALFGPDIKAMQFILLLVLNNIAFFLVAGLSGYLSDQLENVGTELKKTGLSLKAARELNQLVIENIPSGLITFDSRGDVLQHNEASRRILGLEGFDGANLYDILKGFEPREADEPA
nr:PAS domain-containing protein [Pseudobdellovibrionaceae bacterium]